MEWSLKRHHSESDNKWIDDIKANETKVVNDSVSRGQMIKRDKKSKASKWKNVEVLSKDCGDKKSMQ